MPATASTPNLGLAIPTSASPDYQPGSDIQLLSSAVNALEATTHGIMTDNGAANALSITLPAGVTLSAGAIVAVKVKAANTGATTIAVNGGSAVAVQKHSVALAGAELAANMIALMAFDGAHWQIVNL